MAIPAVPSVSDRQGYIGGSDAGAVLGLSPFQTLLQLWAAKTGRDIPVFDAATKERFYFGHLAEPIIAQAVAERYGLVSHRGADFYRSEKYPFMGGHVDFVLDDGSGFIECKNVQFENAEWGKMMPQPLVEDGSHLVPDYYLAQCLHYMVVLDMQRCYLCVLIGGCQLRIYLITRERNAQNIEDLIAAEKEFWEKYVLTDEMPEPAASVTDALLKYRFSPQREKGSKLPILAPSESLQKSLADLGEVNRKRNRLKKQYEQLRCSIIVEAGGPAKFVDDAGQYHGYMFAGSRNSINWEAFKAQAPTAYDIAQQFLSPSYYFVVKTPKEAENDEDDDTSSSTE